MNLQELKEMIKEEWESFNEQEDPTVNVSDADVDADGGEDSEETLRQIYDMLKDYFEGGDDADDADDAGDEAEEEDAELAEEKEELQERFKKLANIIKG